MESYFWIRAILSRGFLQQRLPSRYISRQFRSRGQSGPRHLEIRKRRLQESWPSNFDWTLPVFKPLQEVRSRMKKRHHFLWQRGLGFLVCKTRGGRWKTWRNAWSPKQLGTT